MNREEFFETQRVAVEAVKLGEGRVVHVRELPVALLDKVFAEAAAAATSGASAAVPWMIYGCANPDGSPLFGDEDRERVGNLPRRVVEPLIDAIHRLNGFNRNAVEDATKN